MSYLAKNYNRKKISFKLGKGSFLYSTNGKKYLDFVQGIAVNSLDQRNNKSKRGRKSKFKSLIIEKDFEPENPKQLEQLDESSCKWPIGHPDESSFYFCGRSSLKDFSYCKLHLLYAYQPKGKKEEPTEKEEVPDFIEKKIQSA